MKEEKVRQHQNKKLGDRQESVRIQGSEVQRCTTKPTDDKNLNGNIHGDYS
jgi:hypothetical protein